MPTNNNPNKFDNDIEDERQRRQEQASQQSRDEMGRFEDANEVSQRPTSRMDAPDDEELHEEMSQGRSGQSGKNRSNLDDDDRGAEEAEDMPVSRDLDVSEDESDNEGNVVGNDDSGADSESEGDGQGRAASSQVGRSKQSINASKRPRDSHGRFESANRSKKRSADGGANGSAE